MANIRFSEEINSINQRDITNFFSMLYADDRFKGKTIFVNTSWEILDKEYPLMKTVFITLQVFKPKEKGMGTKYVWHSYRAKNFACSSSGFELTTE